MHARKFQRTFDAKAETNNGNSVGCRALMSWVSEGNVSGNIVRKYNGNNCIFIVLYACLVISIVSWSRVFPLMLLMQYLNKPH